MPRGFDKMIYVKYWIIDFLLLAILYDACVITSCCNTMLLCDLWCFDEYLL